MLVRVFANPDGSVQLAAPALKPGESDQAALARYLARLEKTNPLLAALPHVDVDAASLPPREQRYAWRVSGDQVIADPSVPRPGGLDRAEVRAKILAAADFEGLKSALLEAYS